MRRLVTATAMALVVLATGGCGDDEPEVPPAAAPAKTGTSPTYGIPLPKGAKPDAEQTTAERESFFVPAGQARFVDLDAFYRKEMDERPFRELAWCGATTDAAQVYGLRLWKREGGDDVFTLSLKFDPGVGTEIHAVQSKDASQECPPPPLDE